MNLKKNTQSVLSHDSAQITPQISEAVRTARTNSRSAFEVLATYWRRVPIDSVTWDNERAALTISAGEVTATLAVPNRYHGESIAAMYRMEPTTLFATLDESEDPATLKVFLDCAARPDWNFCIRPEAAVIA